MNTMAEDTLLQKTAADYLLNNLNRASSIYGMDEVLDTRCENMMSVA